MKFFLVLLLLIAPAVADEDAVALLKRILPELEVAATTVTAKVSLTDPTKIDFELAPEQADALHIRQQLLADVQAYLRSLNPKFRAQPKLRK